MFGQLRIKVGYTNFKNSYIFNRKELDDAPHININFMLRTISLWWIYFKIIVLTPLHSLICTRHQDCTHKGVKDHVTLCISSKVKGFNVHHKRNYGFLLGHQSHHKQGYSPYHKGFNHDIYDNQQYVCGTLINKRPYPSVPWPH